MSEGMTDATLEVDPLDEVPVHPSERPRGADRAFVVVTKLAGLSTLAIMAMIGGFLLHGAWPALRNEGLAFFTRYEWNAAAEGGGDFGIAAIVYYTVVIAVLALVIAVPLAVALALFINEYAPIGLRGPLTSVVNLLAAVPSIIYGLWGRELAVDHLAGAARWLSNNLGFIPIFEVKGETYETSTFIAAVTVSLMVLPIATAVMREVFAQTPAVEKEGALALGGTRWGMIRNVVLPFGRGGIVGGSMLALGRALGETIAVALLISPIFIIKASVLSPGTNSIGSHIVLKFAEAEPAELAGLIGAGVALFGITLIVNFGASAIVARSRSGSATEI
jgi:phosphate transport system permease protein